MSTTKTINIGGDPNDANYRYKMEPLRTKIEGRGNGVKTVLVNVVEVSNNLRTLPEYTTKFFGVELGARSEFNQRRQVGIVNGRHQGQDLQDALQRFVDDFILCPQCRLPELQMGVRARKDVVVRCASCGHMGTLPTRHRLKKYIVKNPPTRRCGPQPRTGEQTDRRVSTSEKPGAPNWHNGQRSPPRIIQDESWSSCHGLEQLAKQRHENMMQAVQCRRSARRRPRRDVDDGDSVARTLRAYIAGDRTVDEICFEVDRIVLAHDFDATKKMKLIFNVIFDLDESAVGQFIPTIEKNAELLERFTRTDKDFFLFIGCVEEILTVRQTRLADRATVSRIFLAFYDHGVLDEEQLTEWYTSPVDSSWLVTKEEAQIVRELAAPFMEWLEQAEEDESNVSENATVQSVVVQEEFSWNVAAELDAL